MTTPAESERHTNTWQTLDPWKGSRTATGSA